MTISASDLKTPTAVSASINDEALSIELSDGRRISAPLAWYPRLLHATDAERGNCRIIGQGSGLHWPDVEEDISVDSIVKGRPSMESPASLKRWLEARARSRSVG